MTDDTRVLPSESNPPHCSVSTVEERLDGDEECFRPRDSDYSVPPPTSEVLSPRRVPHGQHGSPATLRLQSVRRSSYDRVPVPLLPLGCEVRGAASVLLAVFPKCFPFTIVTCDETNDVSSYPEVVLMLRLEDASLHALRVDFRKRCCR
jgi:hypothetical protein